MPGAVNGHAEGPTIPASADTLLRFQRRAADAPEDPTRPVALLAAPTEKLLTAYFAGCAARGIRNPSDEELVAAMGLAIERTKQLEGLDEKVYAWNRSLVERYLALPPLAEGEKATYERVVVIEGVRQLEAALGDDPQVQKLRALRDHYAKDSILVACAVALRGIENLPGATVEVQGLEATPESLAHFDESERQMIGLYWLSQRAISAAQKKTSGSEPPSPTTPEITPAVSTRARGRKGTGRSRAIPNGATTPSSVTLVS